LNNFKIMKKTKTGLHIQTRKNRIEVYTEKELAKKRKDLQDKRDLIVMLFFAGVCGLLLLTGYFIGVNS